MFSKLVTVLLVAVVVATQQGDSDLESEWAVVDSAGQPTSGLTMRLLLQGPARTVQERTRRSPSPVYTGYFPSRSHGSPKSGVAANGRILHRDSSLVDGDDLESLIPTDEEILLTSAQSVQGQRLPGARRGSRRLGYSGTVAEGKSRYVSRYNQGVPVYGAGEPYYFSYTHNFPIGVEDFENLVNSHNLPKKYKFTGSLDVTGLLER